MVERRRQGGRPDGRRALALRPVRMVPGFMPAAEGSVLIEAGATRVVCTASVQESVPPFLRGQGRGWVTAEYAMLPRSTGERVERERRGPGGRTHEIQRLIGRSLRAVVDAGALGERSVLIDCDVLQADAGTRTASITGGFVALALALDGLRRQGVLASLPLTGSVAAVSAGIVDGRVLLDLVYDEDRRADVDINVVMTGAGRYVEVQGTAEGRPFSAAQLGRLLVAAGDGIRALTAAQRATLAGAGVVLPGRR
ncbi:MAG TPA: ribonuclease PH [Candidatus Binatia bacterium]|nr:ribonuclease PH [Candidatus Binatia bacterium]